MIHEISSDKQILDSLEIIKSSFKTVADEFGLTHDNCPTHPSFITYEKLSEIKNKGVHLFGLFIDPSIQIGVVAVERGNEDVFYIEKLAVLPQYRRRGYGKSLMKNSIDYIRKNKGRIISIGIINEHPVLKDWYKKIGFKETITKHFDHLPFTVCFLEMKIQ
jgi:GNAT superfamily N-acetyltransferase